MHHGPTQREEHDSLTLEIQLVEFSNGRSTYALELGENYLDLHFDQLAAPRIGDPKLQCGLVEVRSDYRVTTVNDSCRRP